MALQQPSPKDATTASLRQPDFEILKNPGQPWGAEKRHNAFRLKFCNRMIIDSEIGRAVETRWVNDPVRLGWVLVKRQRPPACQVLALGPNDVGWDTHPDRIVAPEVDQVKVRPGRDLRIAPLGQFHLLYRKIVDKSFSPIPEYGFEKAYLQAIAEIENAKPVGRDPPPRIAEAAWGLPVTQRIRIGTPVDPTERPTPRYGLDFELCASEVRWRRNARHSVEIAPCHTFRSG